MSLGTDFAKAVWQLLGGRNYIMATWFAVTGFFLELRQQLHWEYMLIAVVVQAIVAGRSIASDLAEAKRGM